MPQGLRIVPPIVLLCLAAATARAQEPVPQEAGAPTATVTLQSLIEEARQRSPGLQAKQRAYEAARARVISAWLPEDPEIGADIEGQSGLFRFDRTDTEYSLMQTVPFPTKLLLRGRVAAQDAQIAYQAYKEKERDVIWHLEQPYAELFLANKTVGTLETLQTLAKRLAQTVQTRYETSQASQQDLLKADIESSKLDIELFQWRQQAQVAEAHMSHVLNRPLETSYTIAEEPTMTEPLSWTRAELERMALEGRPELKALEIGIRRAKTQRLLSATSWLPDLTGRIEARHFSGESGIREYDTFLGLTVPVWSLIKGIGGEWKGAGADVQEAEAAYTEMKNEVLLAVYEAYAKAQTAEHALATYEHLILPQARQQVDVALASYEAGRMDMLSLIDAQRTLKEANLAHSRMKADYELGLSDLRLAVGGPLKPTGTPASNPALVRPMTQGQDAHE